MKFEFSKKLYLGKGVLNIGKDKVIKDVKLGKPAPGIYLISKTDSDTDMLEILPYFVLKQKYFKHKKFFLYGLASGKDEAIELLTEMFKDCLNERKDVNLKEFLS